MSPNQFQDAMNLGHTAAWDQKWEDAAGHYRTALAAIPDDTRALISMGLAMFELERYEESLRYYAKAAQSNLDDPLPFEKVAQIAELVEKYSEVPKAALRAAELYLKQGETERAIENLARVTRADARNLAAHSRLALIYEQRGRKGQAVTEYLAVAGLFQQKGQMDHAKKAIRRALSISPESKEARLSLDLFSQGKPLPKPARTHAYTSRHRGPPPGQEESVQPLRSSQSQVDPIEAARQKALEELAGLIFEPFEGGSFGQPKEPARGLQAIMRGTPRSLFSKKVDQDKMVEHLRKAVDLQSQGMEDKAAEELEAAMEVGLDQPAALYDLGFILSHGDRLESAIRYLQKASETSEYMLGSHLLLGETLRKMGRQKESAIEYLKALQAADGFVVLPEQADDLRQLYEPLIDGLDKQNDLESISRLCDTVSDFLKRPDWRDRLDQARRDFQIDVKSGPAIPLGEVISQASGSQIIESIMKVHQLARQGYMRSAMEEAYFALQHAPSYLPLHIYMGELLLQQDRIPEAIAKFNTVSQTYYARGETDRAVQILRKVIRIAPMNLMGRKQLIDILLTQNLRGDAVHEYIDLAGVYYNLADLVQAGQAYAKALEFATMNGKNQDLIVDILHHMADINLQSLDWRQALKVYERIRTISPEDVKGRESLIEINLRLSQKAQAEMELEDYLQDLGSMGETQKAQPFLERMCAENPDEAFLRKGLIQLYKRTGRKEEAIRWLDDLGEVRLQSGDRLGAMSIVEEILGLDPPNRMDYLTLLKQLRGE